MTDKYNRPELNTDIVEKPVVKKPTSAFKKGIYIVLAGSLLAATASTIAFPQGAVTLVQIVFGGTPVTSTNGLPVNCITGCSGGGGGAVTIANGADTAEGSTTDSPATTPTTGANATVISLLKALVNGIVSLITNTSAPTPAGTNTIGNVKSGSYISAGAQQNALAVATNTQLTVPSGTTCAQITVEGANIRRTSDTTSATTSNGTLIQAGAQWQDCGPLAAYKFTAVSGSPTMDAEYFK